MFLRPLLFRLTKLSPGRRLLYIFSLFIFFWSIFDGVISFLAPILIVQRGFSNTEMGLIIAFSSVAGALIDFVLIKLLRHANYLRIFLLILAISFVFPFVLWSANHLFVYLLAMVIWGLYYDLYTFGTYDFVSHNSISFSEHSSSFGVIELFRSLAGLLAPLFAAYLVVDLVDFSALSSSLFFLTIAAVFYLLIFSLSPLHHFHTPVPHSRSLRYLTELKVWRGVGRVLLPVLVFMVTLYIFDATFWTIGPLFSQHFPEFPHFGGVFMTLYNLPTLFTVWHLDSITSRFGKKRTAFVSFIFASLFLIPLGYLRSPFLVLFFTFLSAVAASFTWPAIEGAVADYVSESPSYGAEIEGLVDLTSNIGYIIGPITAGVLADKIGISHAFSWLGIFVIVVTSIVLLTTPRHIRVVLHRT